MSGWLGRLLARLRPPGVPRPPPLRERYALFTQLSQANDSFLHGLAHLMDVAQGTGPLAM